MTTRQFHKTLRKITLIESMSVCAFLAALFTSPFIPFTCLLLICISVALGIYTFWLQNQLNEDET